MLPHATAAVPARNGSVRPLSLMLDSAVLILKFGLLEHLSRPLVGFVARWRPLLWLLPSAVAGLVIDKKTTSY